MEGIPRVPMVAPEMKVPSHPFPDKLRSRTNAYIAEHYQADPDQYDAALGELEQMRTMISRCHTDVESICVAKRYYAQLVMMKKRFPMEEHEDAIKRAYKNAVHHASRNGPDDFAQMRFVVCAPPHGSLVGGTSVAAAVFLGIVSVAYGRRVRSTHAVTGNIGETGRLRKIGALQAKTIAAVAAEKTDICMPFSNREEWYQIDNLIRMEIRPHFVSNVRQLAEIMLV